MATKTRPSQKSSGKPPARDLFDESTMTFGEHLEVLRVHVLKGLAGLIVGVLVSLLFGEHIVNFINQPIDAALIRYGLHETAVHDLEGFDFWRWSKRQLGFVDYEPTAAADPVDPNTIEVAVLPSQLAHAMHAADPKRYPKPAEVKDEKPIPLRLSSPLFGGWADAAARSLRPVTLNVQEAFLTYLKVALVSGIVIASPWLFYQVWQFVAAGLYPNERKYVHIYLPLSLGLFLGGAVFCFYLVLPYVLDFLLGFNKLLSVVPQIRQSEWVSFALLLPVMFGLSFQLPLVMLFLERLQILDVKTYREKRRMSILVIAVVSMFMTPADPMSMMLMMFPLLALYELGIWMCTLRAAEASPFEPA